MKGRNKLTRKLNKDLARLGDAIVNFIISAALTVFYQKPVGLKVKNDILKKAWLSVYGRSGIRRGLMAPQDLAEAYIAYLWLNGELDLDNAIKQCARKIIKFNPISREEVEMVIQMCIEELLKTGQ